jgi:hypothetical protein
MLIITNRNIIKSSFKNGIGNHKAFGDEVNSKGPNEIRLATANKINGEWQVELIKEPSVITKNNIPSQKQFLKIRDRLTSNKKTVCFSFMVSINLSRKT